MKISRLSLIASGAALVFAASAFAGNGNKGGLHLAETVTVEGKQLAPGNYKVEWEGNGPDVQLNIVRGKTMVATVPARLVPEPVAHQGDGYGSLAQADGSKTLTTVFFDGKKYNLEVGQREGAKMSEGAASGQK